MRLPLVAALLAVTAHAIVRVPLPKSVYQETLRLPLAKSSVRGNYNVVLMVEKDHDVEAASTGICSGISDSFNMTSPEGARYAERCRAMSSIAIREARGLDMQHEPSYAAAVHAMHEKLSQDGYMSREFEVANVWARPYRAAALRRLIAGFGGGSGESSLRTVCEVGFGAGHSSLLFLTAAPLARVHAFDASLARYTLPAQDYLDDRYPERLILYAGESASTLPRLPDYFPNDACQLAYIDGGRTYEEVSSDLRQLRRLVANDGDAGAPRGGHGHIVVLAGAGEGTDVLRAWMDMVAEGQIAWELTFAESPTVPLTDRLVVGRFLGTRASGVGDAVQPLAGSTVNGGK